MAGCLDDRFAGVAARSGTHGRDDGFLAGGMVAWGRTAPTTWPCCGGWRWTCCSAGPRAVDAGLAASPELGCARFRSAGSPGPSLESLGTGPLASRRGGFKLPNI